MLDWFDFYGLTICFTINQETRYRTRLGSLLSFINLILILLILPLEFLSREDIKHNWNIPTWKYDIIHNPTMFQKSIISEKKDKISDFNSLIKSKNAFSTSIHFSPSLHANMN